MIIDPDLPLANLEEICDQLNAKAIPDLHAYLQQTINPETTVHVVTLRNDIKQALNSKLAQYHAAACNQQLITWSSSHSIVSMMPSTTAPELAHELAETVRAEKAAQSNIPPTGHFFRGIRYCIRDSAFPQACQHRHPPYRH